MATVIVKGLKPQIMSYCFTSLGFSYNCFFKVAV